RPDGSNVVFEVNDEFSIAYPPTLSPDQKGFFLARSDGSEPPIPLGPASRDKTFDFAGGSSLSPPIAFSPNGRRIAFTDLGPGPDGHDAVQIVVLDLGTDPPTRTPVTTLPSGTGPTTLGESPLFFTCCPRFIDDETVLFQTFADPGGLNPHNEFAAFTVGIDGRGLKVVPRPAVPTDSHVVPSFGVFGRGINLIRVGTNQQTSAFPITEIFLQAGKKLLQ